MTPVRVRFVAPGCIRVFKLVDGKISGRGVLIRTLLDFSGDDRAALIRTVILSNWRIVVWLLGGRLK